MLGLRGRGAAMRLVVLLGLLAGLCASAHAQLFAGVDWFRRDVGQGVTWRHYWFDSLFGSHQSISYLEADLDDPAIQIQFPYLASSRQQTSTFVPAQFPTAVAAVNGTFFVTAAGSGGATTYLRIGGTMINPVGYTANSNWNNSMAIAKTAGGVVDIVKRPSPSNNWANNSTHTDILANGPILQDNGVTPNFASIGTHCSDRHPRTFLGITADNRIILATADGRTSFAAGLTCDEMADVMEALGCVDSFSVDGGGSTTMWVQGEPYSGVVNFPSDNGVYDHLGERSCSNAIAIVAPAVAAPAQWDGRLTGISYTPNMLETATQNVTFTYQNIGSQTWTAADTKLMVSRPNPRTSVFQHASWPASSQPVAMSPASVATGQTATFTFAIQAPDVSVPTSYLETFALYQTGVGRFGPADNEARLSLFVELPIGSNIVVESRRPDGTLTPSTPLTSSTYLETPVGGLADTSSKSVIPASPGPIVVGSGARYTSNSVANQGKKARFRPLLANPGLYSVYVTVGAGSNNDCNAGWEIKLASDNSTLGSGTVRLAFDDTTVANNWKLLASNVSLPAGSDGYIEFTNNGGANRFVMDAVRFELTAPTGSTVTTWQTYE